MRATFEVIGTTVITPRPSRVAVALAASLLTTMAGRLTRIGLTSAGVFDQSTARVHQGHEKAEDRREVNGLFFGPCLQAPGHMDRLEDRAVDVRLFVVPGDS